MRRISLFGLWKMALFTAICLVVAASCSSDEGDGETNGTAVGGGPGAGSGGTAATGGSPTGGSSTGGSAGTGGWYLVEPCNGLPLGAAGASGASGEECVVWSEEAQPLPVDMFIMMDRSTSMVDETVEGGSMKRWEAVTQAIEQFVQEPSAQGIRVGLQFFPASGAPGDEAVDCDVSEYATPEVPIAVLPEAGDDIIATLQMQTPNGLTPTQPALDGALQYAQQWAADNPDRATIVVLVTDGYPTQCTDSVNAVADLARAAREGDPSIPTFVIGVGSLWNLASIAWGGGTVNPYILEDDSVTGTLVNAMLSIASTPMSCEFAIPDPPPGRDINLDEVQVIYAPIDGEPEEIPRGQSAQACVGSEHGGWFYQPSDNPTSIRVCDCNCQRFGAGRLEIRLGCNPATLY